MTNSNLWHYTYQKRDQGSKLKSKTGVLKRSFSIVMVCCWFRALLELSIIKLISILNEL